MQGRRGGSYLDFFCILEINLRVIHTWRKLHAQMDLLYLNLVLMLLLKPKTKAESLVTTSISWSLHYSPKIRNKIPSGLKF